MTSRGRNRLPWDEYAFRRVKTGFRIVETNFRGGETDLRRGERGGASHVSSSGGKFKKTGRRGPETGKGLRNHGAHGGRGLRIGRERDAETGNLDKLSCGNGLPVRVDSATTRDTLAHSTPAAPLKSHPQNENPSHRTRQRGQCFTESHPPEFGLYGRR